MQPLISIVIPSFNQGKYIEQTIVSIIEQSYKSVEIIIIDAASTDETVAIIKKYEQYIAYWVSEPDSGQAHAINKGLLKCTGQIFNWINSDDYLEPNALQNIVDLFVKNESTQIVCGYTCCFYDDDNSTSHEYIMGVKPTVAETITKVEMNQPGTFYLTEIVKSLGGVNESLRYVFDDELWFKYLCMYGLKNIHFLNCRVANFRLHKSSKSVGEGFELFAKEIQSLYIDIAKNINMPQSLLDLMLLESNSKKYETKGVWITSQLEKSLFHAHFANRYLNTLFISGKRQEAKNALKILIQNGQFKWSRIHLSLFVKLSLIK